MANSKAVVPVVTTATTLASKREIKCFAWSIGTFKFLSNNWRFMRSGCMNIFHGQSCCSVQFAISREIAQKKTDELPDVWIFRITTYSYYRPITSYIFSESDLVSHLKDTHDVEIETCKRYLLNTDGTELYAENSVVLHKNNWAFQLSSEQLEEGSSWLKSDVLEFRLELKLFSLNYQIATIPRSLDPPEDLAINLGHLLDTQEFSDFTINTADEPLKVHKTILAMRSPVFKAMLKNDRFEENKTNEINMDTVNSATMRIFLRYIYTDKLEFGEGAGTDLKLTLFQLADQYQIPRLKALSELELVKSITTEAVSRILEVADTYGAKYLRESSLVFIGLNKFTLASDEQIASLVARSKELSKDIMVAITRKLA